MPLIERPELETLQVLVYPDKRLRQVAGELPEIDGFLNELSDRMSGLMTHSDGIGLAATQIGWPFRFIVINPSLEEGKHQALVNPVVIERDGRIIEEEGCLSVPGVRAKVKRADYVRVRAETLDGDDVEIEGEGLMARLLQHEIDHLEGRLFVDCVGPASRVIVKRRLKELAKRQRRQ
jgi:peptide deformylase